MRILPFLLSFLLTTGLIVCLSRQWGQTPILGQFFSPQHGFWQNAEPVDQAFDGDIKLAGLKEIGRAHV